jgi:pimeloyl-ACP methyl ester carboxylesterase
MKTTTLLPLLFLTCASSLCGCVFVGMNEQLKPLTQEASISGWVYSDSKDSHPIVMVARINEKGADQIVRYNIMQKPGEFHLKVPPGTYELAAFQDENSDLIYEPGAPAGLAAPGVLTVGPGQDLTNVNIQISHRQPPLLAGSIDLSIGGKGSDLYYWRSHLGEVISFNDLRFDDDKGDMGLWDFARFRKEVGGGLYFLEEYDPKKIPVLFIHGYTATPRDFQNLVKTLDRSRFQPWFVHYPSAMRISEIAEYVDLAVKQLRLKYKFKKLFVVGYSMGGLVGRSFILKNTASEPENYIKLFVSISTPWNGTHLADFIDLAPAVAPSWEDLAVESEFIQSLFATPLPAGTEYCLLFSYKGDRNPLRLNNDGFIALESALDPRAEKEAVKIYGINQGHEEIIDSKELFDILNEILSSTAAAK